MTHSPATSPNGRTWRPGSLAIILAAWLILQLGGLFSPGLLDDVDSVYIQIAREMLARHDFITPTIDGIRFFDKPPLMYWLAAGSMRLFGVHDWAARLPLALAVLALLFATYALGNRLFAAVSRTQAPDRAGLYAALAMATSIGPYLYTRFFIPDIVIALWMTLAVHLFLLAVDRTSETFSALSSRPERSAVESPAVSLATAATPTTQASPSALLPMLGFGAVLAFSVLTKGLIGTVFPLAFAVLYLAFTGQLRLLLGKLHLLATTAVFFAIAAPWHILAAIRNPAIAMPTGVGLPARARWSWFYLYNEHVARFLGRRIPHDYGQVPIPLFWLLLVLWLAPWAAFLFPAVLQAIAALRQHRRERTLRFDSDLHAGLLDQSATPDRSHEAALTLLLWAGIILGFFTLSSRQEYYHLPALPALALLVGGLLAAADCALRNHTSDNAPHRRPLLFGNPGRAQRSVLRCSAFALVPFGALLFLVCGYLALASPRPPAGATLHGLLSTNPDLYNLSLGHVFDLTGQAMGFFRGPLLTVALGMLVLGPIQHLLRRRTQTFAANLLIAAGMTAVLLAAHEGLVRFNPILGSKDLAQTINTVKQPGDLLVVDGELTSGSTLLFYSAAANERVFLVNGRVNGPWFGSFWPDSPHIFLTDDDLRRLWAGPQRLFLLTYNPTQRRPDLTRFAPVHDLADSGGKTILTNR